MITIKLGQDIDKLKNDDYLLYWTGVFNNLELTTSQQQCSKVTRNGPLSRGSHFVSGDLQSFAYTLLASFSLL